MKKILILFILLFFAYHQFNCANFNTIKRIVVWKESGFQFSEIPGKDKVIEVQLGYTVHNDYYYLKKNDVFFWNTHLIDSLGVKEYFKHRPTNVRSTSEKFFYKMSEFDFSLLDTNIISIDSVSIFNDELTAWFYFSVKSDGETIILAKKLDNNISIKNPIWAHNFKVNFIKPFENR